MTMRLEAIEKYKTGRTKPETVYEITLNEEFRDKYMPGSWLTSGTMKLSVQAEQELMSLIGQCLMRWESGNEPGNIKSET